MGQCELLNSKQANHAGRGCNGRFPVVNKEKGNIWTDITKVVRMCDVRSTLGVQLGSWLLLLPQEYSNWATVSRGTQKGKSSSFYNTMEKLLGEASGDSLTTKEAIELCERIIKILWANRVNATWAWLDQNCCLY